LASANGAVIIAGLDGVIGAAGNGGLLRQVLNGVQIAAADGGKVTKVALSGPMAGSLGISLPLHPISS